MKTMPTVILMTSYISNALIKDLFTLLTIKRVESIFKIVKKNQIISMQWIKRREIERKPFEGILKIELKNKQIDEKILLLKDEYKTNTLNGIHLKRLIFKPIYNDLNKKKVILSQFAAFCLNPKLTEIPKLFWEDTKLVNNDADLSTLIEQKVCKKFAKF